MVKRRDLRVPTPDGEADCHLFHPDAAGPFPGVLFFHDGIGLRESIREMASRFAAAGFAVLLPNLFHRAGAFEPFDAKTVFAPGPERERLMALIGTATLGNAMRDTASMIEAFAAEPLVARGKLGCVGYCLGGMFALGAAGTYPDAFGAAASIHGGRLATDAPDSPHLLAPRISAVVYVAVAETDQGFTAGQRERLERALADAEVRHEVEVYSGVSHGFAVPDTPVYDRAASERHFERVIALFRTASLG